MPPSDQQLPVRKALIPAAGRGTRFLPLTKAVPKELAPLVTTPALEFVVAEAAANGVTDVVLVIHKDKVAVADYFRPSPDLEEALAERGNTAALELVRHAGTLATIHEVEQVEPRGLGDAIAQGEQFADGEPLVVLLPDDLIDDRDQLLSVMIETFEQFGGIVVGLIDVGPIEISKYGCVELRAGTDPSDEIVEIVDLVEKPAADVAPSTLAIIGRYILPPEIFDALRTTEPGAGGEIQVTDAMRALASNGVPVHGVVFTGRRFDIGDRLDYVKAVVQFAQRHPEIGEEFDAWLRKYVSGSL
jgi:UTP--glucose-1-phosphate uridylyltransferase